MPAAQRDGAGGHLGSGVPAEAGPVSSDRLPPVLSAVFAPKPPLWPTAVG